MASVNNNTGNGSSTNRLNQFWSSLSMGRRVLLGTLVLFFGLAAAYVGYLGSSEDHATLFAGLKAEDAAEITKKLDEQKIPYSLDGGGTIIRVPATELHQVRLMLAGEGMPSGGSVGFELFDKPRFGMTAFEQQMHYRRALQGELRRTIRSIVEVEDASIHVVLPKKGTFREDDQEASASIVLALRNGRVLGRDRVNGIVNLVAASVEGLTPAQVTVLDQSGTLLSAPNDPALAGSLPALEFRQQIESGLEKRVLALLEPTVGGGKARVQVSADMDFRKVEQRDEIFDPKSAVVRSENSREEHGKDGQERAGGIPGARANVPGAGAGANVAGEATGLLSSEKTANYEINHTTRVVEEPTGTITKLSVAVIVDGNYTGEGEEKTYVPRPTEELAQLEQIIKTAVGFDETRGDKVVVSNLPFIQTPASAFVSDGEESVLMSPGAWVLIRYGVAVLLALLLLVFLVRPIVKAVTQQPALEPVVSEAAGALESGEGVVAVRENISTQDASPAETMLPNSRLLAIEYAASDPRKTAQILRTWLIEDRLEDSESSEMPANAQPQPG